MVRKFSGEPNEIEAQITAVKAVKADTLALFLTMCSAWWLNGYRFGAPGAAPGPSPPAARQGLWERVECEGNQEAYWHQRASGESAWELPSGAATTCGWQHSVETGQWRHAASGAATATPPPLDAPAPLDEAAAQRRPAEVAGSGHGFVVAREAFSQLKAHHRVAALWARLGT